MAGSTYHMFIDESGTSSPTFRPSYPYILTGIVVEESKQAELKTMVDTLKIKYWGTADIVLHSEDIGKNINDCAIFSNNSQLKQAFVEDLIQVIIDAPVISFHALVDKSKLTNTWTETTVTKKTARSVFFHFLTYLLTRPVGSKGKLIIEASSVFKDAEYLKAFAFFASPGNGMVDDDFPDYAVIKKAWTQISFVTKLNNDTETQLADILAYAAACKYQQLNGASFSPNSYKGKMCSAIDQKMFSLPASARGVKRKMYQKITPFEIFPKK